MPKLLTYMHDLCVKCTPNIIQSKPFDCDDVDVTNQKINAACRVKAFVFDSHRVTLAAS